MFICPIRRVSLYPKPPSVKAASERKKEMLTLAKKTGIATIDLEPAFDVYVRPSDLAFAASTHYSEAVYRLAADAIAKALSQKTP